MKHLTNSESGLQGCHKFLYKDPFYTGKIILTGDSGGGIYQADGTTVIDEDGNVDAPVTSTDLTLSGSMSVGTTSTLTGAVTAASTLDVTGKVTADDVDLASGAVLAGLGTGANGIKIKNPINAAASALSGTQLDVEIDIGGVAYHFTVYPTKA